VAGPRSQTPPLPPPDRRRYLTGQPERYDQFLAAAEAYAKLHDERDENWYYRKPYDPTPGNPYFFNAVHNLSNVLQAMALPPGGTILEVGSGPGWITEILLALGYKVFALDPAAAMHVVSRRRLELAAAHWRLSRPLAVRHLAEPLEECSLPEASADGVLLYESLHHIVREEVGLAQAYRVLRPGGVLAVAGEGVWLPGDPNMTAVIEKEMAEYGTLENPYTREYLDHLIARAGFERVVRYHGVNGFFPEDQGGRTIAEAANYPSANTNCLTARKPKSAGPSTTADPIAPAAVRTVVTAAAIGTDGVARVELRLVNTGPVTLLARRPWELGGFVAVSLCRNLEGPVEEAGRVELSAPLPPGGSADLTLYARLPPDHPADGWHLAAVNEGHYWFHLRPGAVPATAVEFG
jgi:SAM-dependent methyltransferase